MADNTVNIPLGKAARIAGLGLLGMTILSVFAEFFMRQKLLVSWDAITTANNIMSNELLFRLGILSFVIVAILDVVVAWALYVLLKPVNKNVSLLAAWFRLVYSVIFGIALVNLYQVLELLSGSDYLKVLEPNQLYAESMVSLVAFNSVWMIGLVFFGIHLSILGYLTFKSGYVPKTLGILLVIAGLGYIIDSFAIFLLPNYQPTIAAVTFIGEALFMLWLLFKGSGISEMKSLKQ